MNSQKNKNYFYLCEKIKLSQADLADKTRIDRSYISMVERGVVNITYLKLKRIEEVLNIKS